MAGDDDALEALIAPYRERSNAQIRAQLDAYLAEHPEGRFPSSRTMRRNSRIFLAGKRYRFVLAVAGYEGLTGMSAPPAVDRAATWLEFFHLYTLFLDDIMDEDRRRRTFPSAWHANSGLYRGSDASRPGTLFRTRRDRYGAAQAILDALRVRDLAERSIQGARDLDTGVRERLLQELTAVDVVLSDGQGLDIDFEVAKEVTEAEYEAMSDAKTGRLYAAAAATAAVLSGSGEGERRVLETYARHFSIAFQDRDDLLGSGVVSSRIGGSSTGDIVQGKRTRLFAMALEKLPPRERAAFLRSYGKGFRSTTRDVAVVRKLLRDHVLDAMNARIEANVATALAALDRLPFKDPAAKEMLARLARAQTVRVA